MKPVVTLVFFFKNEHRCIRYFIFEKMKSVV